MQDKRFLRKKENQNSQLNIADKLDFSPTIDTPRLVDVVLPLAMHDVLTYRVPAAMPMPAVGARVLVPLGKKSVTGVVLRSHPEPLPKELRLRDLESLLDDAPLVTDHQLSLWQWIASYYMCTLGEVLSAALPAGIIDDDYTARTATYVVLHNLDLAAVRGALARAPKQLRVFETYLRLAQQQPLVERRLLIEESGESTAIVRALVERQVFDEIEQNVSRLQVFTGAVEPIHPLSPAQSRAAADIRAAWQSHAVCLLFGVTSSGKTEVYIHLIEEQLQQGKQVLYLVPEIALTTQLTDRLRSVFGDRLLVYHSRFTDAERVEIYHAVAEADAPRVIIGARSAIFLPFSRLGLVIVDEEHESSYKQSEPAPRYHARSVAILLAQQFGAKVLLGSATPSVESYYNATTGKYGLATLTERYAGLQLPTIRLIDLQRQYHRKEMYGHFSDPLVERIREELAKHKQIILFRNRRGYAPLLQCTACGKPPRCINCDVPLTFHKRLNRLSCHYCGYSMPVPARCPSCGGEMRVQGFGTERIEDEVAKLFPEARVLRMDLDTTRSKTAYQDIINAFSRHEADILVGTQMVSKGLHFDDVSLVAVLNADSMFNQPDFRSYERAFQMLEQVSGRAGRKGAQGEVFIQSFQPDHPVLTYLLHHDYQGLFRSQTEERQMFHYPPFHRLISITLRHRDLARLEQASLQLQGRLFQIFGSRVSPVIVPSLERVQNQFIRQIRLRIEVHADFARAKQLLSEQMAVVLTIPECKGTVILPDVDPL